SRARLELTYASAKRPCPKAVGSDPTRFGRVQRPTTVSIDSVCACRYQIQARRLLRRKVPIRLLYTEWPMAVTSTWSPSSWREFPAQHQVDWPDEARVEAVRARIKTLPALLLAAEARALQASL